MNAIKARKYLCYNANLMLYLLLSYDFLITRNYISWSNYFYFHYYYVKWYCEVCHMRLTLINNSYFYVNIMYVYSDYLLQHSQRRYSYN